MTFLAFAEGALAVTMQRMFSKGSSGWNDVRRGETGLRSSILRFSPALSGSEFFLVVATAVAALEI